MQSTTSGGTARATSEPEKHNKADLILREAYDGRGCGVMNGLLKNVC
jgi:hypothetical protein